MLDDMAVLRASVNDYRTAATAAGVPWPDEDATTTGTEDLGRMCRAFGVGRIAEQAVWFATEALPDARALPDGGFPMPWDDLDQLLSHLARAVGVPFPWRQRRCGVDLDVAADFDRQEELLDEVDRLRASFRS